MQRITLGTDIRALGWNLRLFSFARARSFFSPPRVQEHAPIWWNRRARGNYRKFQGLHASDTRAYIIQTRVRGLWGSACAPCCCETIYIRAELWDLYTNIPEMRWTRRGQILFKERRVAQSRWNESTRISYCFPFSSVFGLPRIWNQWPSRG